MRSLLLLAGLSVVAGVAPLAAVFAQQSVKVPTWPLIYAPGIFNSVGATEATATSPGRNNGCAFLATKVGETCPMCYKPLGDRARTPGVDISLNGRDYCFWCVMPGMKTTAEYEMPGVDPAAVKFNGALENIWHSQSTAAVAYFSGKCPCSDPNLPKQAGKTCFNNYTDSAGTIGPNTIGIAIGSSPAVTAVWVPNSDVCAEKTAAVPFWFNSAPGWAYHFTRDPSSTTVRAIDLSSGRRCVADACSDRTAACSANQDLNQACCEARNTDGATTAWTFFYGPLATYPNGCRFSSKSQKCVPDCERAATEWRTRLPATPSGYSALLSDPVTKYFSAPLTGAVTTIYTQAKSDAIAGTVPENYKYWSCIFAPFLRERGCYGDPVTKACTATYWNGNALQFGDSPNDTDYVA